MDIFCNIIYSVCVNGSISDSMHNNIHPFLHLPVFLSLIPKLLRPSKGRISPLGSPGNIFSQIV